MATTTNYGWTTPDDTDLVKNGADAIRTLGSSIDTSMNTALGTKKAGMVLLNTTTFSAVASQSVGSDASPLFNSTYDNYLVTVNFTTAPSADCTVYLKLRANLTDASTNYDWAFPSMTVGGTVTSFNASGQTTGFVIATLDAGTSGYASFVDIFLSNPFAAEFTSGTLRGSWRTTAGVLTGASGGFSHRTATSYNAINLIASAGNISGVISIFGVNK